MTTASRTRLEGFHDIDLACRAAHGNVLALVEHGPVKPAGSSTVEHVTVLCRIDNEYHPFAVWVLCVPETGAPPFLNQGDYCETLEKARAAFKRRT